MIENRTKRRPDPGSTTEAPFASLSQVRNTPSSVASNDLSWAALIRLRVWHDLRTLYRNQQPFPFALCPYVCETSLCRNAGTRRCSKSRNNGGLTIESHGDLGRGVGLGAWYPARIPAGDKAALVSKAT